MIFPTIKTIIKINRRQIEVFGGIYYPPDNLHNSDGLKWVLDAIQYPLFGVDVYPTLVDKGAILAQTIISGHVFYDGNKRTGMSALLYLFQRNGRSLNVTDDELEEVAQKIARGRSDRIYTYEDFVQWIAEKQSS